MIGSGIESVQLLDGVPPLARLRPNVLGDSWYHSSH